MPDFRDHVIVGSGFGGAIPALRLAEAGEQVMVLERGRRLDRHDFRHSWAPRYLQTLYRTVLDASFEVTLRYANALGGGSLLFSGAMIRPPREVFDYRDATGAHVWPESVTRAALDPHLLRVEQAMQVSQAGWDEVPKAGAAFAGLFGALGLTCDRVPFNYVDCLQCGFCEAGCRYDRKQSLILNYIPLAEAAGAEFRTEVEATAIAPHARGWEVSVRHADGRTDSVLCRRLILAANAIETPALLLRSRARLPGLSDQVGRHFHNNGDLTWYFELPEGLVPPYRSYKGRTNAVMTTYAFWAEHQITIHTGTLPPGIFAGTDISRAEEGPLGRPWGLEHKHWAKALYTTGRLVSALAIGLTDGEGTVRVDADGRPQVDLPVTPVMQAYHDRVLGVARAVADASGCQVLRSSKDGYERGGAHLLGSCRMGDDPARSVCDAWGAVRGFSDLYVSDSSGLSAGTGVNPALTVAANAERIAAHLVETA